MDVECENQTKEMEMVITAIMLGKLLTKSNQYSVVLYFSPIICSVL